MRRIVSIALVALCLLVTRVWAGNSDAAPLAAAAPAKIISPGTVITMSNWQQYKEFMPDTMVGLFAGSYFWKMNGDVRMEVGPTVIHPLPKNYLAATEKYADQVKLVELPTGGLSLTNYHGGIPFPNPAEPHKGWKTLANLWYRYIPYLTVDTYGSGCAINSTGNYNCQTYSAVKRQLSYNTDTNAPAEAPGPDARYFTEWFMTLEPEQDRYTAYLTINYADPEKPEEAYAFLPALRRYQAISTAARCSETQGMDATFEDFHNGFDSNLTQLQVDYIGRRQMLALVDVDPVKDAFPGEVAMPLGFPEPKWGKWQVRGVDVLDIKKITSQAAGYCYGRRVIYADAHFAYPLWEDLYDKDGQLWKIMGLYPLRVDVPGVGRVDTAALDVESFWDIQHHHASFAAEPYMGHPMYVNDQAPKEYDDLPRYTTASGLNLIMR